MLRIAILRAEMEFQPGFPFIEEPSTETEAAKPSPLGSEVLNHGFQVSLPQA